MGALLVLCVSCRKQEAVSAACDEISVLPVLEETKATLIPAGNLTECRIHIDGYNNTSGEKHIDGNILYNNTKWIFYTDIEDVHYYWPQNSNLDVLAYSPAKIEKTCIEVKSKKIIECTGLPLTDALQEDNLLDEFICGYKEDCKKADGAISITLKRPFAIVNFYLDEAVRSTLKKIEITGMNNKGKYDVSTGAWTEISNKSTFCCNVNKVYPTQINNNSHLGGPFLVIPQDLHGNDETNAVKLVFTYRSTGNSSDTVTETTLGQSALENDPSEKIGSWEPGKRYDYYISLNGAANEVRMAVKITEWKKEGNSEVDVK